MGTIRLTYIGRRLAKGGGLLACYIDENGRDWGFKKVLAPTPIGGVTVVEQMSDSQVRPPAPGTYATQVEAPQEDVDRWRLEERAAVGSDEQRKLQAKLKTEQLNLSDMTIGDIARRTDKMLPDQRAAIVALVLRYLMS